MASVLEWVSELSPDAVVVLAREKDGGWSASWSKIRMADLTFAERVFSMAVDRHMLTEESEP